MNAEATAVSAETAAPAKPKRTPPAETKVAMKDGREVIFVGDRKKMSKDVLVAGKALDDLTDEEVQAANPSDVSVRFDFKNGTTRTYECIPALAIQFLGHGMGQKYGDYLAGEKAEDLDDWAESLDKLHEQLKTVGWRAAREPGESMAGTSILARAMVEASGKTMEQIRAYMKTKDMQTKLALRQSARLKPIVDRLEKERVTSNVDVDAALAELDAMPAEQPAAAAAA